QILAADGLIKVRPNKGAVVLGINEQTIREHYEIRALLESEAVAKASRPGTDISRIAQVHYAAEKALAENNSAEYSDLNQAFHMEIWNVAGNEKMKMLLCNMWNGLSMGHKVTEEEYAVISIQEHKSILQALELHDETLARQRMREHIIRSMENMLTRYVGDPSA
ncbi:FCD domain-containing protein, partial [Salmonella enterica]|nr:FCD domain-containing protein [Salmonella enterica]